MKPGKMNRSYLKFGQIHTESGKFSVELTNPTGKAAELFEFINLHNPNPMTTHSAPNPIAMAIKDGNTAYMTSIKADLGQRKNLKMDEEDDHTNVIDLQINESKTKTQK